MGNIGFAVVLIILPVFSMHMGVCTSPTILYTQLFFEPQTILNYAARNLVK